MTRRFRGDMSGERYLGNRDNAQVHDLDRETLACEIDEIIASGGDVPFGALAAADAAGYAYCEHCFTELFAIGTANTISRRRPQPEPEAKPR